MASPTNPPSIVSLDSFLGEFRARYRSKDVIDVLKSFRGLKVLVVGDTIIDEYAFCRPYGMPLKSPVIAAQFLESEAHAGGILAVANHLAGFCETVGLVTCLGASDSREDFVRKHLKPNVRPDLFVRPDGPTTVKRRYVRNFMVRNLFEISYFNDAPLPAEVDAEICQRLGAIVGDYDLVVVADFGHGFMSAKMVELLCSRAKFLAVNSQLNSINYGFNVITRYPRVDYVCIDEQELRMACRDRQQPVSELVNVIAKQLVSEYLTVTLGHHGSATYRRGRPQVAVPVLSRDVVDPIGAGDAFLSITAPCARLGVEADLLGFIGNAVGALAVRFIGNRQSVSPEPLFELVTGLLE
jgi:bifunctional ADP-heptose synthase (sugar kinase/adenylyltransferase)